MCESKIPVYVLLKVLETNVELTMKISRSGMCTEEEKKIKVEQKSKAILSL